MSAHLRAFDAAVQPAVTKLFRSRFGLFAIGLPLALLLAGCDPPAPPLAGPDPSDPGARAPRVGYRSTIAPYKSQRPVDSGPWEEQNQRVAPQPKSSQ
jgi:hypothetical protein